MITTIITTYKRPRLLKRALKSVLNQTYPHFKVCVYDNASNDETEEIVKEFIKTDARVEYYKHAENIGMMPNYAFAYSRINTPYFSFLSDDDYLLPWFYETALENFKQYPEAAFSACGVLAVNANHQVVADTLSAWSKEGFYSVPEGIIEMLTNKNFPTPTGILFQHKIIETVKPDWSKEIQVMWDPDYLIQIASRYPLVITKKVSSIFFAHEEAFSTGFYKQIIHSADSIKDYLKASKKLLDRVKKNKEIPRTIRKLIRKSYISMLRKEIGIYMRHFIHSENYEEAYKAAKLLFKYFGINKAILLLLIEAYGKDKHPDRYNDFEEQWLKKHKEKLAQTSEPSPILKWRSFDAYKEYSSSISD